MAAPLYGGLVSDLLPDAQVTVFADGAGAYPDEPGINTFANELWGTFANVPNWEVNEGLTVEDWGAAQIWVQAGLHDPEIVMSRFDHAYDEVQTEFMELLGLDTSDVGASMAAREAEIEAAGVVQHSFTAPGTDHTLVREDEFYDLEVGGVTLARVARRRGRRRGRRRRHVRGVRRADPGEHGLTDDVLPLLIALAAFVAVGIAAYVRNQRSTRPSEGGASGGD